MATIEKLIKAFEGLKMFQQAGSALEETLKKKDQPPTKKDKMANCSTVADCICAPNMRSIPDFPKFLGIAIESFLMLCDDPESDVRMVADECLNRTIKTLLETNLGRLQVELYKEIKKNGPSRSLRAAVWRFAEMCHLIRPQKCRPYVVNLLPCLARISQREEEAVQETLALAMQKICPALMAFANDTEVKILLKAILPNLKSTSAVTRRTAASSLCLVCQHSRNPVDFLAYLTSCLLDMLLPVDVERESSMLLGAILCFRHIIPLLGHRDQRQQGMQGSFGIRQREKDPVTPGQLLQEKEDGVSTLQLMQLFQLLLYFTSHKDHNVMTTALEALQQLLRSPPPRLRSLLLQPGSFTATLILSQDIAQMNEAASRVDSTADLPSMSDDVSLEEEADLSEAGSSNFTSTIETEAGAGEVETSLSVPAESDQSSQESTQRALQGQGDPTIMITSEADYSNVEIADLNEERSERSTLSHCDSSSRETLLSIKSLSPKRRPPPLQGQNHPPVQVSQDLNGNPEYDTSGADSQPPASPGWDIPEGEEGIRGLLGPEPPLVFCVRLLCRRFLLSTNGQGLIPDRLVRVSLKSLALGCLASTLRMFPALLLYSLAPDGSTGDQQVRDVLEYASHPDPQLKGQTAILIGSFVRTVLAEGRGDFSRWLKCHSPSDIGQVTLEQLVETLVHVMEDDSSVATRQALLALQLCLEPLLHSCHSRLGLQVLLDLLHVKDNPYWLVKVELLDLLSNVNFKIISYLETFCGQVSRGQHHYLGKLQLQDHYLHEVAILLLGDDDARVRHAAASCLQRLVPRLFFATDGLQQDPVATVAKDRTDQLLSPMVYEWATEPPPPVQGLVPPYLLPSFFSPDPALESSLSRLVQRLLHVLHASRSKHLTSGCCHALCLLSEEYYVSCYASAWGCGPPTPLFPKDTTQQGRPGAKRPPSRSLSSSSSLSLEELTSGSGGGPLPIVLSLLTSSPASLDLPTHQDVLQLAGNLMAGSAFRSLRNADETSSMAGPGEEGRWAAVSDRLLVPLIDLLLTHVARILNVCTHVIEDVIPGPPQMKTSLPSLPTAPSLSPVKRKVKGEKETSSSPGSSGDKTSSKGQQKDQKDSEKEKSKKDGLGAFHSFPQYMRLYEVLRGAFSNYKNSLELSGSDKFCSFLRASLVVFAQILEMATMFDIGKYAEEFLHYLKSAVTLEPTHSVLCVQQLLKALFGTNLASQWEGGSPGRGCSEGIPQGSGLKPGLYKCCLNAPYSRLTHSFAGATFRAAAQPDLDDSLSQLMWLRKRIERKVPSILKPGSKVDKGAIAAYIRLFEPLVIKALKQYTVTSSLELQQQVLDLLAQLVQLRVNYCLLDSDQIFIGFVLKQFELIEEGQMRHSEILIPHMFQFLVMLSYEKFHSKSIIDMPRIMHHCDRIMASGLHSITHAIPALRCVVFDLFLLRGSSKGTDVSKELETQREVVVSMLLRLTQYHQALEMLVLVLQQCHRESEERWKRLSRQVIDLILPALAKQQIYLDSRPALDVLHRLFESVAPSVFRPADILLKTLLAPPANLNSMERLQRWLCLVLAVLRVLISQSKEEVILSRMQESGLHLAPLKPGQTSAEPLCNLAPEETMAWFLLQVVGLSMEMLNKETTVEAVWSHPPVFVVQQLAHLLLYITHMFQSGLFRRVATAAMTVLQQECPEELYGVQHINRLVLSLAPLHPTLALHWGNILILLNFHDHALWGQVMQTPQKYLLVSPSRQNGGLVDRSKRVVQSCNMEILRRGGLILFCDYVCENLSDAEHMTWVIINHVSDLIELSHESPVQDFISAIHRNSAASSLFIQAIHARCEDVSRPSVVRKTLQCLEAIHLTQSGALLTLLIDKFLPTHQLAVARLCDTIACRRVEMLLAENVEDSRRQLPLEDLDKLLQFMKTKRLVKRHARLSSLLYKFRGEIACEQKQVPSLETSHPLASCTEPITDVQINKELYMAVVREQCHATEPDARQCAFLLQRLDYADILSITMTKEFSLSVLEECISLGAYRTLVRYNRDQEATESPKSSPVKEPPLDPLYQAAQLTMFRHINNIINHLPVPHQLLTFGDNQGARRARYMERMEDLYSHASWFQMNFDLAAALTQYLVSIQRFPWEPRLPPEAHTDVCRFALLCMEMVYWMLHQDQLPTSERLQTCLECTALVLQVPALSAAFALPQHCSWVCSITATIYQLVNSLLVLPGEKVSILPHQDRDEDQADSGADESAFLITACDQISELVHCLQTRLRCNTAEGNLLPPFIAAPIRNIIISLGRLPLVNTYARTPPLVWRLGWSPSPTGEPRTCLPPLPVDFLQEKDVLKEFVFRINTLGWVSRQQFEETWMSLLGVLNPASQPASSSLSPEEEMEQSQGMVIAVKAITTLLLQSTLTPNAGNPSNSVFEMRPRDKVLAFLYTRCGKKLALVRGLIEQEIQSLCAVRPDRLSHHAYSCRRRGSALYGDLFGDNLEREAGCEDALLGQISIDSIWSLVGALETNLSESDNTDSTESPVLDSGRPGPLMLTTIVPRERSVSLSGLDIHSCLQFLLELYGSWLVGEGGPKIPLMLLNAVVQSIVRLSDLFMEREQFEWMMDTLLEVHRAHAQEDELINQYLVVGVCKAAAVLGSESPSVTERVLRLLDTGLKTTHLPGKVMALHGALYLLESGPTELTRGLLPLLTEFLSRALASISQTCISSQQFVLTMWATVFYILENCHTELKDVEFPSKMMQLAVNTASGNEDSVSTAIFLCIMRGLERLLLSDVLSKPDTETIIKLSMDRLCLPNCQRALAALGLMFTCMYSGKQLDQYSPHPRLEQPPFPPEGELEAYQDPESLILAMERVTVLFDRIKKGYPYEARVITRLLPAFLADFFPPQDIMNKVIGEFLSSQQPYPQLVAKVVFQVFNNLQLQQQQSLVRDWVMLSLSNFTQRSPLAMAAWSLTCFFISASTNSWLRALFPHVLSRMGKMEVADRRLFCLTALDFHQQLTEDGQRRAFVSTFQSVAPSQSLYQELLASLH